MPIQPFTDTYFMKQALAEARLAAGEGEVPVGAVVVCDNRIIAREHNRTEHLNDPTAHAELLAITAATGLLGAKYLTNCTLYVTIEPCVMCAGAIGWSQIHTLIYGASDEKRGYQSFAPEVLHPKTIVKKRILEDDCAAEMKLFFQNKR
jgi:tRNA(adenine34) deaminase